MSDKPAPVQAVPGERHWIVMRLSNGQEQAVGARHFRRYFRHPSEGVANAEAERLAGLNPGIRFAVYARGKSFKVEAPAEAPAAYVYSSTASPADSYDADLPSFPASIVAVSSR